MDSNALQTSAHFAYRNWYWRGTTLLVVAVIRERNMMRK
jgi:hypothetical protein